MQEFIDILKCNECGGSLEKKGNNLICLKCGFKYGYTNEIMEAMPAMTGEKKFSCDKWEKYYKDWYKGKGYWDEFNDVKDMYQKYGVEQIEREAKVNKETIYLEIGCGTFFIGQMMAEECELVIGIDFSMESLLIARQMLKDKGIDNFLLIHGDIFKMPIKTESVNLIYGGGVIEHFEKTQECVDEYGRVTKKGGVALNAVPILNIGALTYRQIWGNIPDFPILKQLAKFIHMKVLRGKHMHFGYELSFTKNKLIKVHNNSGFRKVCVKRLDTQIMLDFMPKFVRPFFRKLAFSSSLFWPMALVVAEK